VKEVDMKRLVSARAPVLAGAAALVVAAALGMSLLAEAAGPIAAPGAKVYVNGVDLVAISGIRGMSFPNATVVFDVAGNVHINIPGFAISGPPAGTPGATAAPAPGPGKYAPPPATAAPGVKGPATGAGAKRPMAADVASIPLKFYLVTEVPRPGFTQYDVEIWVNDTYIGVIKNEDGPLAVDVHDYIRPAGKNTLRFKATKRIEGDRRSTSAADYIKIILTEGRLVSGAVLPETRLFEFTKTAADVASATSEYMVEIHR
jgi:hypothetical protein